ncbi:MAG: molybdate ABC transporter substrate-binding protein [Tepidanaerobacteraceae bacterium]|mgnify:CR=1 FL=1|jgi:molybdate transport system substrate-binding protein
MRRLAKIALILAFVIVLTGCSSNEVKAPLENSEPEASSATETTILVAAAASLKNVMDNELIPLFIEQNPNINVNSTYDSSGKLQTQIEEGAEVDVFMSAAMKQMNALAEKGLIDENSVVELLENKIVLIVPKGNVKEIHSFEEILKADTIAVGDPESVPAGQYAKEALEFLKLWDETYSKSSLGTNVTQVLNWVAEGSADVGVVYATDAASNDKVEVVAAAPEGSVSKIIYPAGMVKESQNKDAAKIFLEFLQSAEASEIFEKYGFTVNE